MSHHDDHHHDHAHAHHHDDHDHAHHHGHDHHHGHAHTELSFDQKLEMLLDHWIQHNDHHVADYRGWADKARQNNQAAVADLLSAAADLTETVTQRFKEAAERIEKP